MSASTASIGSNGSTKTISDRKLAANRANAQKSTGPRTPAGKQKSSLNALTHGLRSRLTQQTLVCESEREDFTALAQALQEELNPQTPLQHLLAERLSLLAWKLRRTAAAESALLDQLLTPRRQYRQEENDKALRRHQSALARHQSDPTRHRAPAKAPQTHPLPTAPEILAQHAQAPNRQNPWLTLHRYEQAAQREFHKTLAKYQSLQRQQREDSIDQVLDEIDIHTPNDGPNEPTTSTDAPGPRSPSPALASSRQSNTPPPQPNEPTDSRSSYPTSSCFTPQLPTTAPRAGITPLEGATP